MCPMRPSISEFKNSYDPVKIIQAEWSRLGLGDRKYQGDWLRIGNKPNFDFSTEMRDGPLNDFFISVIFVLSIGNPVIEGRGCGGRQPPALSFLDILLFILFLFPFLNVL